jgi:hypothetical protein
VGVLQLPEQAHLRVLHALLCIAPAQHIGRDGWRDRELKKFAAEMSSRVEF